VRNLNQYYGGSHILRDVGSTFRRESHGAARRNGVGKTTLLKTLMGLVRCAPGRSSSRTRIHASEALRAAGRAWLRAAGPRNLCAPHSGREPAHGRRAGVPERISSCSGAAQMLNRRGGDLSGGQQQQLAIGRALAMNPRLLILDEPTEGIQPSIIKDIERVIRALAATGEMAILLVEQYYDFARSLADQYLVMERGEIVARGAGADMERDGIKALLFS
jgi:urea transport system ATP-binding protein